MSWSLKRQATVALSTTELEYIGLSHAMQQTVWLTSFSEIDLAQGGAVDLLRDNSGSVCLMENSKHHALVKHIEMRHHYIWEKVTNGTVKVLRIVRGEHCRLIY